MELEERQPGKRKIGRQGDEGNSIFVSLEDDLMRIFGSELLIIC